MSEEPNTQTPLVVTIVVEVITYVIYFSWLSVIAAGALYLDIPPLSTIEDAVDGPWQGTAAAIALGALSIATLRVVYEALRARMPQKEEAPTEPPVPPASAAPPETEASVASTPAVKRAKKKRKRRKGRKR